ncbi:MAG: PmbA/TldA family metallopeptidase, partial [Anaerolineae bacterium]
MRDLVERALNVAQVRGAWYADMRIVHRRTQVVEVRNGLVEALSEDESRGFGVRVLVNGAWGFASSARLEPAEVDRVTALAVQIARASARVPGRQPVHLGPPVTHMATYRTPVQVDPFAVPLERKIALLVEASRALQQGPEVRVAKASLECQREWKVFGNTEGAFVEQEITETGAGLEATAVGHGDVQKRSYPNSFGRHQATRGYELVESLDLVGHAPRVGGGGGGAPPPPPPPP